jgi:hypothetical protein
VSGTFRNIAGTISSLDTTSSTLVVKDLATKKQVTIHITADAQMRKLPDRLAAFLAMRLKGTSGNAGAGGWGESGHTPGIAAPGTQRNGASLANAGGPPGMGSGPPGVSTGGPGGPPGMGGGMGPGGGDPQQMLSRAPAIQIADLKKGDAVMLVSTDGTTDVTAITLLAGVEPLLEAPAASQNLLNNWSMGSGSGEAAAAQ